MSGKYHWFTTAYSLTIAALLLALGRGMAVAGGSR